MQIPIVVAYRAFGLLIVSASFRTVLSAADGPVSNRNNMRVVSTCSGLPEDWKISFQSDCCQQLSTLKRKFIGKWIVVADTAGQGLSGELDLKSNGTFSGFISNAKSKDTAEGIYSILEAKSRETKILIRLLIKKANGRQVKPHQPVTLKYDEAKDIISDGVTIAYRRAGKRPLKQSGQLTGTA